MNTFVIRKSGNLLFTFPSVCLNVTDVAYSYIDKFVHVCGWAWQCDGFMMVSSHMANHVEQWARRHGTGGGEM